MLPNWQAIQGLAQILCPEADLRLWCVVLSNPSAPKDLLVDLRAARIKYEPRSSLQSTARFKSGFRMFQLEFLAILIDQL